MTWPGCARTWSGPVASWSSAAASSAARSPRRPAPGASTSPSSSPSRCRCAGRSATSWPRSCCAGTRAAACGSGSAPRPSPSTGDDRVRAVTLTDGTTLDANLVVESVGSLPNTEWLGGNGLDLADGVACDGRLRVLAGDTGVAGRPRRRGGGRRRGAVPAPAAVRRVPQDRALDGRHRHRQVRRRGPGPRPVRLGFRRGRCSGADPARIRRRCSRRSPRSGATSTTCASSPSASPAWPTSASWRAASTATSPSATTTRACWPASC